jgi:hypothetical protein
MGRDLAFWDGKVDRTLCLVLNAPTIAFWDGKVDRTLCLFLKPQDLAFLGGKGRSLFLTSKG